MGTFNYISMAIVRALALIIPPVEIADADELLVRVDNIKEAGDIHIAIYDDAAAFEADRGERGGSAPGITQRIIEMVERGWTTYRYMLPLGAYAIGIFHGGNLNNRLDNYFFGVPRKQYGFNNNVRGFMGPPSFKDATFSVGGNIEISFSL